MTNDANIVDGEIVESETTNRQQQGLVHVSHITPPAYLTPVMTVQTAMKRLGEFQEFIKGYLEEGEDADFGIIPGTKKKTLFQSGADKLCEIYGLCPKYEIVNQTVLFDFKPAPLFDYDIRCSLIHIQSGQVVATGLGSCNSHEDKYLYRDAKKVCPSCGQEAVIKGREEFGGGWLCFTKKGGCGMKWPDGDSSIESQKTGRTINEDIPTIKNTILKMACKRAKVAATITATRSSGIFTQDMDDIVPKTETFAGKVTREQAAPTVPEAQPNTQPPRVSIPPSPSPSSTPKRVILVSWPEELGGNCNVTGFTATIEEAMKKDCQAVYLAGKKEWIVPAPYVHVLYEIAHNNHIEVEEFSRDKIEGQPGKGPAADEKGLGTVAGPRILEVWRKTDKKGNLYLQILWNNKKANCFKADLIGYLEHSKGQNAELLLEQNGNYLNVVGINSIGPTEFHENAPVIQRG